MARDLSRLKNELQADWLSRVDSIVAASCDELTEEEMCRLVRDRDWLGCSIDEHTAGALFEFICDCPLPEGRSLDESYKAGKRDATLILWAAMRGIIDSSDRGG